MTALLALPALRWALGAVLALALILGALAWLRHDAAQDARHQVAVEAAAQEQETRHEADDAARAAERDGAGRLLGDGRF